MSERLKKLYKPCAQLDKYDNEPYMKNPLLKLKMSAIREGRRHSSLQNKAVLVKMPAIFTLH